MRKITILIVLLTLIVLLSVTVSSSFAQGTVYSELYSIQIDRFTGQANYFGDGRRCVFPMPYNDPNLEQLTINYTITGSFGNNIAYVGFPVSGYIGIDTVLADGFGNEFGRITSLPAPELTNNLTINGSYTVITTADTAPRPWTLIFRDGTLEIGRVTFDPASFLSDCGYLPYVGPITVGDSFVGDDLQIYESLDGAGNFALDIYGINNEGEGYYLFSITEALLAPFIDTTPVNPGPPVNVAPPVNTLVVSVDNVALYVLTTGEYQLNIGPDEEGKVRVIIFEGLPPTNVYSYDFNVYDILEGE